MMRSPVSATLVVAFLCTPLSGFPVAAKKRTDPSAPGERPAVKLPLEEAGIGLRRLSLSVDEATWLSVDVAPEGDRLVMEVLGDLYTLPIGGGEAVPLLTGLAFDSQPAYSPDGKWLAFLSDRDGAENLWIVSTDGTSEAGAEPRKLSREQSAELASPSWTPDSQYVVVSRAAQGLGTYELWLYHREGGRGVQITRAKEGEETPRGQRHNALGAVASPDGRFFYYAQRAGGFEYNVAFPRWQIARRDRTTGDEDVLTAAPGSAFRPRLSPDGLSLVYATRLDNETGLKVRELASGEERWLAYPVQRDEQESRYTRDLFPGYAFTPDGRSIVATWGGRLHRVTLATGEAEEIPFRVSIDKVLGPSLDFPRRVEEGPVRARITQGAVQSPDGKTVAFSALTRLYLAQLDNGQVRQLSPPELRAYQPTWSPDGEWIAFVTWAREGGHVFRVRPDGSELQRLTRVAAYYSQPSWSPDGERIVGLRGPRLARLEMPAEFGSSPLALDLVWLPAAGGAAELIAPSRGLGRPHFGPEAGRIYVYSPEGLVSLRYDGTDRREHLKIKGPGLYFAEEPVPASEVQISPDGRWALARVSNRFVVAALPRVGGSAPEIHLKTPSVPIKKLTLLGADSFAWAGGGETLTWTLGSTFFRLPLADVTFDPLPEEALDLTDGDPPRLPLDEKLPEAESFELAVQVERSEPRGVIALRGVRIVTLRGPTEAESEVIEVGDLIVEGNRIRALGAFGEVQIPADAFELNLRGHTVVPGFVNTHAHWTEIRRGVLDTESWPFLATLAWGVTTGLDVQTGTNDTFAYQDLIDAGEMVGPRAYSTGPGIFSNNDLRSLEQAKGLLSRYRDHYRTRNLKAYISGNRRQRHWIVRAASELEMMPTTEGALDLKLDLTHAIDGFAGNEHSLPVVPLLRDVVELYATSGTGYTPTLLVAYGGPWAENDFYTREPVHDNPKLKRFVPHAVLDAKTRRRSWFREDEHIYPRLAAEAAKILRAGGRVGVGGHGQLQGLGYHWEMWALASGGLSEHETLYAATRLGAEIIGLASDLGSLEAGKLADLVVLRDNPLADIRNTDSIRYVMKNGELFDGDSLDRIWPEPRKLDPLWWWESELGELPGASLKEP